MSVAFAIKDRCGFNLTAPEETILLESYRQVGSSISAHPAIKSFEAMFFGEGKAVDEAAIIAINEAVKVAELPVHNRIYPKPTDWTDFTRTRGNERIQLRQHIMAKLNEEAERTRLVNAARREYIDLPPFYIPEPGYPEMFMDAVDRIKHGAYRKRPIYAPEPQPPIIDLTPYRAPATSQHERLAAPKPERLALATMPSLLPAAARVAQAAQALALHRDQRRQYDDQLAELQRKIAELGDDETRLNEILAQAVRDL